MDLFEDEQRVLDNAVETIEKVKSGQTFCFDEFIAITKEYGRLLKQLRRSTRIADRTTVDLHESNLSLEDKVNFDGLTGIYNRRFMEESLTRVVSAASRSGGGLSVLMLDIDYFKKYNDTYGHAAGDEVLKLVAEALSKTLERTEDFVARYGGEEFAVILPNTDEQGACYIAEQIIENVQKLFIFHENSEVSDFVSVSVGVTSGLVCRTQNEAEEYEGGYEAEYIKRADKALYMSKHAGRNRYTYLNFKEDDDAT